VRSACTFGRGLGRSPRLAGSLAVSGAMPERLPVDLPEAHLQDRGDLLRHVIDEAVRAEVGQVRNRWSVSDRERPPVASVMGTLWARGSLLVRFCSSGDTLITGRLWARRSARRTSTLPRLHERWVAVTSCSLGSRWVGAATRPPDCDLRPSETAASASVCGMVT
jgi:hypothetical protein